MAWEPDDQDLFKRTYLSGFTNDELARAHGATRDQVDKYLLKMRSEKSWPRRGDFEPVPDESLLDNVDNLDVRLLATLKSQGLAMDVASLADKLDVSPKRIREAVDRLSAKNYLLEINHGYVSQAQPRSGGHTLLSSVYLDPENTVFRFGLVSDEHLCSRYARLDVLNTLFDIFEDAGITQVLSCGNWIDGEFPKNKADLLAYGVGGQLNYFLKHYPQRSGISTYFISGDDHEGWAMHREQVDLGRLMEWKAHEAGRDDLHYLGYMEHDVIFRTPQGGETSVRLMHPGGGSAYAVSYQPQKIIESLSGGTKSHIYCLGHYHKAGYFFTRNVHTVLAGTTQAQTPFMRKKRLAAHLGGWVLEVEQAPDGSVVRFSPTFYPFFEFKGEVSWRYENGFDESDTHDDKTLLTNIITEQE